MTEIYSGKAKRMNNENKNPGESWIISGVECITGDTVPDTWDKVSYDKPTDGEETTRYLAILKREISLYPAGYIVKALARKIVIGKKLAFNKEYRAAVPDPYRKTLYLSVNGSYGEKSQAYLAHVLHHELHHMVEYSVWKDMYFSWAEWNRLNPAGFSYGGGGLLNANLDYYSVTHPVNGFLNLYSMTGGEEDRCELVAFLMNVKERPALMRYYHNDSILRRKVRFIVDFVNNFAGEDFIEVV